MIPSLLNRSTEFLAAGTMTTQYCTFLVALVVPAVAVGA